MTALRRRSQLGIYLIVALLPLAFATETLAQRPSNALRPDPILGVSANSKRFTVNGVEEYLIFFSYFDALDQSDAAITANLQAAWNVGFSGVRIFPNWWNDIDLGSSCTPDTNPLITSTGALSGVTLGRLQYFLNEASRIGFIVDISFAMETVSGLNPAGYDLGIRTLITLLGNNGRIVNGVPSGYRNVLIDVANEYDVGGGHVCKPVAFTASDIASFVPGFRAADPLPSRFPGAKRLLTASPGGVDSAATQFVGNAKTITADLFAAHPPRTHGWWGLTGTGAIGAVTAQIASTAALPAYQYPRPLYHQEPGMDMAGGTTTPYALFVPPLSYSLGLGPFTVTDVLTHAAAAAKLNGAAAFTFHTEYGPLFGAPTTQSRRVANGQPGWTPTESQFFNDFITVLTKVPWGP
jgi:hypothetical protein